MRIGIFGAGGFVPYGAAKGGIEAAKAVMR